MVYMYYIYKRLKVVGKVKVTDKIDIPKPVVMAEILTVACTEEHTQQL